MSCYEWEAGTIKLPAAEFPKVYKAVLNAAKQRNERAVTLCGNFWKELPAKAKKDPDLYGAHAMAFAYGNQLNDYGYKPDVPNYRGISDGRQNSIAEDIYYTLISVTFGGRSSYPGRTRLQQPRRVTKAYVEKKWPATNRTTTFHCGESTIRFDKQSHCVHWEVAENNHARDYGREHEIAQAFFTALRKVHWTRGSGGKIIGNDEYNRDDHFEGGGGNYVVDEYPPPIEPKRKSYSAGLFPTGLIYR